MKDQIKMIQEMNFRSSGSGTAMDRLCEVLLELSARVEELELRLEAADALFEDLGEDTEAMVAFVEGKLVDVSGELLALEERTDDLNGRIADLEGDLT
jgi:hypothetical protein